MKHVLIVPDGMADRPLPRLQGRTPLEVSRTPGMDFLYRNGLCGVTNNTPRPLQPASDVANLSILGCDPIRHRISRGALEALARHVPLGPDDIVFRMNFVTVRDGVMEDFTAGHISDADARRLVRLLNRRLAPRFGSRIVFHAGVGYRNLMVLRDGRRMRLPRYTPPHDITDRAVLPHLPPQDDIARKIMDASAALLADRRLNPTRATSVWLYGQGPVRPLPSFRERFGLSGALISAVDLIRGIGRAMGLHILRVPGITGYFDTNYANKGLWALKALGRHDFVFIHIEAPDEAGHQGDIRQKILAIERIDRHIVRPILQGLRGIPHRVLLLPDHRTPISLKTHVHDDVPFLFYDSGTARPRPERAKFSEKAVDEARPDLRIRRGHELLSLFLRA